MSSKNKFSLLHKALKLLGLSDERAAEIIVRIQDWLQEDKIVEGSEEDRMHYPYHLRDFLSSAELNFYRVLVASVNGWAIVCPKVNLGDLFYAQAGDRSKNRAYRNRIARKHVDFLLCDPQTVKPLIGVELDDKSHQRADRRQRDKLVDAVFKAADLPLVHIPVQYGYDTNKLGQILRQQADLILEQTNTPASTIGSVTEIVESMPDCPKCNAKMMLRTAKRGANVGKKFWGCSHYPKCRGVLPFREM